MADRIAPDKKVSVADMDEKIPFEAGGAACMGADVVEGACRERPGGCKKIRGSRCGTCPETIYNQSSGGLKIRRTYSNRSANVLLAPTSLK